mgnify:CR=1 FL=1
MAMINIIGNIRKGRREIVGYRLVNIEDQSVMDVTKAKLVYAMKNKLIEVENAKLHGDNTVMGKKYALDDLGTINTDGTIRGTAPIVITTRIIKDNKISFICVDIHGKVVKLSIDKMTQLCLKYPVVNIRGGYRTINLDTYHMDKPDDQKIQLEEVIDREIIWDIPRFEMYMKENGYTYTIKNGAVANLDPMCKNIKIPAGIRKVVWYKCDKVEIDNIIISPTVDQIYDEQEDRSKQHYINNIYFQRQTDGGADYGKFDASGLRGITVGNYYNLPHYKSVMNMLNDSELPYINMSEVQRIIDSFNDVTIKRGNVTLEDVRMIRDSFNNLHGVNELEIGKDIADIGRSFGKTSMKKLEFKGENDRLLSIHMSFASNNELTTIHWGSRVYDFQYMTFKECIKLNVDKFPKYVGVAFEAFKNSNIKEVFVPKEVKHRNNNYKFRQIDRSAFDSTTKIIYDGSLDKLTRRLASGVKGVYEIEKNFKIIESRCFYNAFQLDEVVLHEGIAEIQDEAFRESYIKTIDFRRAPKIDKVGAGLFFGAYSLGSVILSNNIKSIKEDAFKHCPELAKIVMPKDIEEIGEGAFTRMGEALGFKPTCYIVRGGSTEKLMNRRRIVNKVYVDSIEEGVEYVLGKETASEKEINKFRLLMQNTEFAVLLEKDYIGSIGFVYRLINQIRTERNPYDIGDMKLNTHQLLDKPIDLKHLPHLKIPDKSDYGSGFGYSDNGTGGYNLEFISKCNLITSLTKFDGRVLKDKLIEQAIKHRRPRSSYYIYYDDRFEIIVSHIRLYGEIVGILFITDRNKLIYATTIDDNAWFLEGVGGLQGDRHRKDKRKLMYTVSEHLVEGDIIHERWKDSLIGRARVPSKFNKEIYNSFISDVAVLSHSMEASNVRLEYVYSIGTGKVFRIESSDGVKSAYRSPIKITGVYSLEDVLGDKKAIGYWYKSANNEEVNRYIDRAIIDEDTINSLINSVNAYKIPYASEIMGLATEIYEKGITNIQELSKDIVESIAKTGIIEPFNHSINQVETLNRIHVDHSEAIQIGDGSAIILQYQLLDAAGRKIKYTIGDPYYAIGVVEEGFSKNNKNILYKSEVPLKYIIDKLYKLGEKIKEVEGKNNIPIRKISNSRQKDDEFTMMLGKEITYIQNNQLSLGEKLTYGVYIQQCSGEVLLMASYKGNLYAILRFKESKDAFDTYRDIGSTSSKRKGIAQTELVRLVTDLDRYGYIRSTTNLSTLRSYIKDGLPEGYPYVGPHYDIFTKAAKQPK